MEQAVEPGRRPRPRRPGGGATDKQERFVRLIEQGVSNAEACRTVGINRRTGTRWRFGRTIQDTAGLPVHYPPVTIPRSPQVRHPRYLSAAERLTIADLHREARTLHEIAAVSGRCTSTISRELRRNADPVTGRYLPATADKLAAGRVVRPRPRRVTQDAELHSLVVELLGKRWSPEQVAHELAGAVPRPTCAAAVHRDPLSGHLRRERRDDPSRQASPASAPSSDPGAGASRPADGDDDDRRPTRGGRRPPTGVPLGR